MTQALISVLINTGSLEFRDKPHLEVAGSTLIPGTSVTID